MQTLWSFEHLCHCWTENCPVGQCPVSTDEGLEVTNTAPSIYKVGCLSMRNQFVIPVSAFRYQQILHRNIVYLGTIADASPDSPDATAVSTP
ncbi:hypothetical protein NFI96_013310 [Prochilodus magdalenae]|nr:hypothetical protein NFI96_013310 [Prochilodus magdalenae]